MVSVCLPSDVLSQHLLSYLGFSYLGPGVAVSIFKWTKIHIGWVKVVVLAHLRTWQSLASLIWLHPVQWVCPPCLPHHALQTQPFGYYQYPHHVKNLYFRWYWANAMWYGILFNHKKNKIMPIWSNTYGPRSYHTEWSKSEEKDKYCMVSLPCGF